MNYILHIFYQIAPIPETIGDSAKVDKPNCPKCCSVEALGTIARKMFAASSVLNFWPEDTPFAISPFMAKNNEFILVHLSSAVTSGRTVLARVKNAFFSMIGSATRTTHIDLESKRLLWEKPGTRR